MIMNLPLSPFTLWLSIFEPYYQVYTNINLLHFPCELTFYHYKVAFFISKEWWVFVWSVDLGAGEALNSILSDTSVPTASVFD